MIVIIITSMIVDRETGNPGGTDIKTERHTDRSNCLHQHRKVLRTSRGMSQKEDVHLCIMCLRAIMNYQVKPRPPLTCLSVHLSL